MALRLSIDPGAEYLLPFAKKKLAELKASSLINRVIEVQSGERIFVQRGLVDQIRITGGARESFYLTVSCLPRHGLAADEYVNFYFSGGTWHLDSAVPLYPQPGFETAILDKVRDSVIRLLPKEKYTIAAVLCTQYFSTRSVIGNAVTHTGYSTGYDAAIYAEVGGVGLDQHNMRFTFDPTYAGEYFWGDEKLQKALEPFFGTFSHSIYPLDPPYRLGRFNQASFDRVDYYYEAPGTDDVDETGSAVFSRYGPIPGGQAPLGNYGGYTSVSYTYTFRHATYLVTGQHFLNSVTEKLFKRTHAGWVEIYNRAAPITRTGTVTKGPFVDANLPYLDGDVHASNTDFGSTSVFAISPSYSEYYGATTFRAHWEFDGITHLGPTGFRPSASFSLTPAWDGVSTQVVAASAQVFANADVIPNVGAIARIGVGPQFVSSGNFSPIPISGRVLSAFVCPATGNRYSKTSDGVYRLDFADGSPVRIINVEVARYRPELLYYGETGSTQETVPQVGTYGPPPSDDYFPAYIKYSSFAQVATASLTLELAEIEEYFAPLPPVGGFCVYHALTGGVIFGRWSVSFDEESGFPALVQAYVNAPSEATFEAIRPLFSIYYQSGLSLGVVILARNGYTLVIA